jgi:hypothetical protein
MTAQKLYEIVKFLDDLDRKLDLQTTLETVGTALSNLVSQPAQPQYQSQLANALIAFENAAGQLGEITPSQYAVIEGMGGGEFFDPSMVEKVEKPIQLNAMTPSVARDFVQEFAAKRATFLSTVRSLKQNLENLKITASALKPGSADLAFLIPRDIFDNELVRFAKELNFISRLLQDFSEGLTGQAQPVELEQLSSSIPTVALLASAPVIGLVAFAVNKFLEAWERIEKIRKLRAELAEMGLKGTALEELTEQITTTVDEVVEETTKVALIKYPGAPERKNELETAIRQDTRRLFGQIERGLTVEFRAEPETDGDPEEQKTLTEISNLARVIQFPHITPEPMLLKAGEILEGDIQTVRRKKTTTQKTTVSKRVSQKEGGVVDTKE